MVPLLHYLATLMVYRDGAFPFIAPVSAFALYGTTPVISLHHSFYLSSFLLLPSLEIIGLLDQSTERFFPIHTTRDRPITAI